MTSELLLAIIDDCEEVERNWLDSRKKMRSAIRQYLTENSIQHGSLRELARLMKTSIQVMSMYKSERQAAISADWGRKLVKAVGKRVGKRDSVEGAP